MYLERHEVSITTTSGGAGTGYTGVVSGRVHAIRYVPDATAPYDTGVDMTITGEVSGIPIITVTDAGTSALALAPRMSTVTVANAAVLYAAGGAAVTDLIPVARERIKVVIAQGGDTKTGVLHIYVG